MDKIKNEIELSKKHLLLRDEQDNTLLQLTTENVARVEAMIATNSSYSASWDSTRGPTNKYRGSSAFWFKKLDDFNNLSSEFTYKTIIENIVAAVDSENSTHLNSDGHGRAEITNRILKYDKDKLFEILKNKDKQYILLRELSEKTTPDNSDNPENLRKGRKNLSFASKFCHFACYWLLKEEDRDSYSIYDSIISKNVLKYAKRWNVNLDDEKYNFNNKKLEKEDDYQVKKYIKYQNLIDEIINRSGNSISRNGFDKLLWYFHKGWQTND